MSKKLILLALAAVSAALFAMPALASAEDIPLHLNPTPSGAQTIDKTGGAPFLTTTGGGKIECETFSGSATFESGGTTGSIDLDFSGKCHDAGTGASCNSTGAAAGTIATTTLPFHLVTLANEKPGILITPNASTNSFAHIECAFGLVKFTVNGNGLIGTITEPACGKASKMATINFATTGNGIQEHTKIAGTETSYTLIRSDNGQTAAESATGTLTLSSESTLECT